MKLAFVGVGDAGTRIVDRLVHAERSSGRSLTDGNVLAFNTDDGVFKRVAAIPEERCVLLGDTHPAVSRQSDSAAAETDDVSDGSVGSEETQTDATQGGATGADDIGPFGVGGDPNVGAAVAEAELPEIRRALDRIDETEVAATMVVAGLGGGTGSGVGSVLLKELDAIHETPVYVLGTLPATDEPDCRALTAARGIRTVVPLADAVFPVDNEAWRHHSDRSVADRYDAINDVVVTRLLALFGPGERASTGTSEMRIDPADITRTLEIGGLASIGYETHDVSPDNDGVLASLLRWLGLAEGADDNAADAATVKRLVRRALKSTLTLPCDPMSADRVLVILSGPPDAISRKGFETGRYLLEEETGTVEVLAGDESIPGETEITATVVLSNVTNVPRIEAIQRRGVDTLDMAERDTVDASPTNDSSPSMSDDLSTGRADESVDCQKSTDNLNSDTTVVEDTGSDHGFDFSDDDGRR